MIDAALAGLILARATGHLEQGNELRAAQAGCDGPARAILDRLVELEVLPR